MVIIIEEGIAREVGVRSDPGPEPVVGLSDAAIDRVRNWYAASAKERKRVGYRRRPIPRISGPPACPECGTPYKDHGICYRCQADRVLARERAKDSIRECRIASSHDAAAVPDRSETRLKTGHRIVLDAARSVEAGGEKVTLRRVAAEMGLAVGTISIRATELKRLGLWPGCGSTPEDSGVQGGAE